MNRFAWLIATAYVFLAVASAGILVSSAVKFVDYSETQIQFSRASHVWVIYAQVTPVGGEWDVLVRWRFDNVGRLPLTIANFQFQVLVDNRTGELAACNPDPETGSEWAGYGAFNLDRFSGPVVPAAGFFEREWVFRVTGTDAGYIVPDPMDGAYRLVLSQVRVVYYIADVETRQRSDFGPRCIEV